MTDDGKVVGVPDPDGTILQVTSMVRDAIRPDVTMFVSTGVETKEGGNIVAIHVQKGTAAPYYLAGKGIRPEGVFVRQGASSVPATESAILRMIKETDGEDYENVRSLAQDLSFDATEGVFAEEGIPFGPQQMRTLGLVGNEGLYTNLALLLPDQNPHTIKAAVFEGSRKTVFKDRFEFKGSLLKQLSEASAFINRYNATASHLEGLKRIDERNYPAEAVREALLNTVVHRDYAFSGPALLSVFDDRIEFVTLGGLVKGITLENLELGVSIVRNKKLANIFYRLGLIEAYGTGVPKIRECYADYPADAEIQTSANAFKITLPNVHRLQEGHPVSEGLSENEATALKLFDKQTRVYRRDVESALEISTTMANRVLNRLIAQGLVERVGQGRTAHYRLKK